MSSNQEKATDAKATKADEPVAKTDAKKEATESKKNAGGSRSRRTRKSKPKTAPEAAAPVKRYQPKLMTEENEEEKQVLIKISRATTVRQVINYSIGKIKSDWKVTFNAFQMEIAKVLVAAEIIKTRLPFLHQENKLITYTGKTEVKTKDEDTGEEKVVEKTNIRSGIQVTLSRNQFEIAEPAGYQKPKPRQFLQPLPSKPKQQADEKENADPHKDDAKKRKSSKNQRRRSKRQKARAESFDDRAQSDKKNQKGPQKRGEEKKQGGRKGNKKEQAQKSRQEKHRSYSDERYEYDAAAKRDRYDPMPRQQRRAGGPPQKIFDSDYDHDPRYQNGPSRYGPRHDYRGSSIEYERPRDAAEHYYRGGPPPMYGRNGTPAGPPPGYGARYPPRRGDPRARPGPPPRGGQMEHDPRGARRQDERGQPRDFDMPHRPGYYAGNRPFRMDKIRDQPLENLHSRAADQIERDRAERAKKSVQQRERRDTRNKPQASHQKE